MRKILSFFLMLFSLSFFAQNDTISSRKNMYLVAEPEEIKNVFYQNLNNSFSEDKKSNITLVSADKMNIVYRGLSNPITIVVPNNYEYTVSAPGLYQDVNGKYFLNPDSGTEVNVIIVYKKNNTESVTEKHTFRIKNLSKTYGAINGLSCDQCIIEMTKEELKTAVISLDMKVCYQGLEDIDKVTSFFIEFASNKNFIISGNKLNDKALNIINKLKIGSIFKVSEIKYPNPYDICRASPVSIKVMIVE